jgi:hypothetical protein
MAMAQARGLERWPGGHITWSCVRLLKSRHLDRRAVSRRALLRALGISAAAAPFVPALDGWAAPGATPPRRLVLLFSPHGVIPETYWPTGGETDFSFPAGGILEPFAPHKADMILFKGLKRPTRGRGAHEIVMGNLWTGTGLALPTQDANGPSIDQIIVKAQPRETTFESLQFGVHCSFWAEGDITSKAGSVNSSMIYAAAHQRLYPENDPYRMFDRLFAGTAAPLVGGPTDGGRLRVERKSILDFVKEELADVGGRVGRSDRQKIEAHLEGTRDIERRLQEPARACGAVTRPDGTMNLAANENHPKIIPLMNQLMISALACDRTRVASLQYSRSFSNQRHTWLGSNGGHHDISHNQGARKILTDIQRWYFTHLASLVDGMKKVSEGAGTMLDSSLVVYCAELYTPWNHVAEPSPCFFLGKAGGAIARTGRYIDYAGNHDHNQFLTTIGRAMGLTTLNKVGDLGMPGILPGILA